MTHDPQNEVSPQTIEQVYRPVTRRTFLKGAAASMIGVAGLMAALKPLLELESGSITLEELLQKRYRELKPEELKRIMESLAAKAEQEYGVRPNLRDLKPLDGVEFGYALNLTRCIGCRKCAHACLQENNQSRDDDDDLEMSYIRVLELEKGAINLETSNMYFDPPTVPCRTSITCRCSASSAGIRPAPRSVRSGRRGREGRRDRGGLQLVHRLPLLHGRLSL